MYLRKTVETAMLLSRIGVLDRENAQICGVSTEAIRHWRRGTRRNPASLRRTSHCPRCDGDALDGSAYAYLLGLYLGDGCTTRGRKGVYALNVACCNDWPGLIDAAQVAMSAVMPASSVPGQFARGLFHSDGYRGLNRIRRRLPSGDRWYSYPRYLFVNESADIRGLCAEALDTLGVAWRYSKRNTISVARREAVARLDEFVGSKY